MAKSIGWAWNTAEYIWSGAIISTGRSYLRVGIPSLFYFLLLFLFFSFLPDFQERWDNFWCAERLWSQPPASFLEAYNYPRALHLHCFFWLLSNRGPVSRGHILLIDMRHSGHMDTSGGDICEMIDEFVVICKLLVGWRAGGVWALMTSSAWLWRISLIDGEKRPVDEKLMNGRYGK